MKGLLGKIEFIVIAALALIFVMWTVTKCNSNKEKLQEQAAIEAREDSIANAAKKPAATTAPAPVAAAPAASQTGAAATSTSSQTQAQPATGQAATASKPAATTAGTASSEPQGSKLFVTIDKLKVRKTPGLKGESLGELKLFDEVTYMNEVTDSTYELNLGKEIANEPYVKIKTKRGTVGWVYGAGVHYVKKKRSGTLE